MLVPLVPQRSPEWKRTCTDWRFRRRPAKGSSINISCIRIMCSSYIHCNSLWIREADDLLRQLQEEQRKTISLTQEMSTSSSSRSVECLFVQVILPYRQSLHQAKEKIRDLEKDNVILRCECTTTIYHIILFFMKGKQRETSELCIWHGERTEIHGMWSNV